MRAEDRGRWSSGWATVLVASLLLTGCSSPPTSSQSARAVPADRNPASIDQRFAAKPIEAGAEVPKYAGEWADQMRQAYLNSQSDLQRDVLRDGVISDREMTALQDLFTECVTTAGLSGVSFDTVGGMRVTARDGMSQGEVNGIVDSCSAISTEYIDQIYFGMQRNPQNEDEATIMSECLVAIGLAPKGYSPQDYRHDAENNSFPFDNNSNDFRECVRDPLAHTGGQ